MRRALSSRPRRRIGAAVALVAVIAVVVVLVVVTGSSSPGNAGAAGTQSTGATTVQRRNLVQSDTESGTLSYSDPATVYNRLSGTITWLPQVGAVIDPGQALFQIDGQPVILMNGGTPAFRTLTAGISDGPDVLELNRNLIRLGFNPDGILVNDTWQAATTDGVEMFQDSLGQAPTGSLTLGQVVFLPGPQIISTVDGALGSTGGGGGSSSAQSASTGAAAPEPEFVSLHPGTSPTQGNQSATTSTSPAAAPKTSHPHAKRHTETPHPAPAGAGESIATLTALLKAEIAQLKAEERERSTTAHKTAASHHSSSSSASHSSASAGDAPATSSAQAILQTTSTHLIVTVALSASSQSEAVVGERVGVEMPNGSTVSGRVTGVSPVAQTSSSSDNGSSGGGSGGSGGSGSAGSGSGSSGATVPVTIALLTHPRGAGLDQASVSVNFVAQRARNVLSVPVTALVATSGNTYAVQEAEAPHKLLPITTGLFAAGYVQISGAGIYPGLQVTDSQG